MHLTTEQMDFFTYLLATLQTGANYQYAKHDSSGIHLSAFNLVNEGAIRYFRYGYSNNTSAMQWFKENDTDGCLYSIVEEMATDEYLFHYVVFPVDPTDHQWNLITGYLEREDNKAACRYYATTYIRAQNSSIVNPYEFGTKEAVFVYLLATDNPVWCRSIVSSAGNNATLEKLLTTTQNLVPFTQWNRYITAKQMLDEWNPETWVDPGGTDDPSVQDPGDNPNQPIPERAAELTHILQYGNDLYVYGSGAYSNGVVFHKSIGQMWIHGSNPNGTDISGGNTGGGSHPSGDFDAMWELIDPILEQWSYIYGGDRYYPENAGGTDCSGFVHWAFWKTFGVEVGYSTEDIWNVALQGNVTFVVGKYASWDDVPWSEMRPGDIVDMSRDNPPTDTNPFTAGTRAHVAIYSGSGTMGYDLGSTPGPKYRSLTVQNIRAIGICRLK